MCCSFCQASNRANATFCGTCGRSLPAVWRNLPVFPFRLLGASVLLLMITGSCVLLLATGDRLASLMQMLQWVNGEPTVVSRDAIVLGMQGVSQLASAKYTIQTIVEVEDRGYLGPLTTDRILLRANADVLAGIDLKTITVDNVETSGDAVSISLPPPTLISNDISFHVYDRNRGWFAATNKDLQSVAEAEARSDIITIACDKGILQEAQTNAESTLRSFLLSLGYKQVKFIPSAPDAAACKP